MTNLYVILKFMPYPETEEFVNVGVILMNISKGKFFYKLRSHKHKRIMNFFPKLNKAIYLNEMRNFKSHLEYVDKEFKEASSFDGSLVVEESRKFFENNFKIQEGILKTSPVYTRIDDGEPKELLNTLYSTYVDSDVKTAKAPGS